MSADLIARLIEAGTPAALVADVAMALGRAAGDQVALSERRERDAARQRDKREREKASRDITVRHGTSEDIADEAPAPDKRNPQTPKKINPTPSVCVAPTRETPAQLPDSAEDADGRLAPPTGDSDFAELGQQLDFAAVVTAWNAMAKRVSLSQVGKLTEERRKRIRARCAEHGPDAFTEAIAAVERSSFCRGANDRGWRADFDFLLQASSFTRLIEGSYDRSTSRDAGKSRPGRSTHPGGRHCAAGDDVFGRMDG